MPSLRITAVAALATAALVVPATASAQGGVHVGTIGTPTQLQVNLPPESAWTACATEGARCEFTGTRQVRYGANGKFTLPVTVTGGVACTNAVFGDPAPGVVKQCQVTGGSPTKDEAATAAAINTQPSTSASSQQACGPTAAQEADLARMVEKLNQQIAQGQGDMTAVAQMIAEMQGVVSGMTTAQQGTPEEIAKQKLIEDQMKAKLIAEKAAQEAAQSQGNLSGVDQAFAEIQNFFNSLFGF